MFNQNGKYLILWFRYITSVCYVLFWLVSYFPQWFPIKNTKTTVHLWLQKLQIKTNTVSVNQQHSNNANFLSFPYNLKSFKCLSMFMKICPDIPHPQKYWQNREFPPFVSTTRPTWMILVFLWNYSSLSLSSRSFSLEKSIPYLISNYYSLPSMISMQQIVPPSKFVIPITAIYLALFVAFFLQSNIYHKTLFLLLYVHCRSYQDFLQLCQQETPR